MHNQKVPDQSINIAEFDDTYELPDSVVVRKERNYAVILFLIIMTLFTVALGVVMFFPGILDSLTGE